MEEPVTQNDRETVLVVDSQPDDLLATSQLLTPHYRVRMAGSSERALALLGSESVPDLMLIDVAMPVLDGYTLCRRIKANAALRNVPIILMMPPGRPENVEFGLSLGAADFLPKPVLPALLLARVRTQLDVRAAAEFLHDKKACLDRALEERLHEIGSAQDSALLAIAALAEIHDNETTNHLTRVQHFVVALASHVRIHPHYCEVLTGEYLDLLGKAVTLHDIGKIGLPDRVLLKPGRFTPEEYEIMKDHTLLGFRAISHAERVLGKSPFLTMAREIALGHHEKWDGTGYPYGLVGEQIPLSARLTAIADVYDALVSHRVFKPSSSHESTVQIMWEGRESHFDPVLLDAFLEINDEFRKIALRFDDDAQHMQEQMTRLHRTIGEMP